MTKHQQLNDEELIRMYLHTQQNYYFETLYNRYVRKVYRRCLSITRDTAQAEDFTHDIFLRVIGNLSSFKQNSAFSTWLYSVSFNYCMDQLRTAQRTTTVALDDQQDWSDTSDHENREGQLQQLAQVMVAIPADETEMLRMKYEEGLDIREIARHFNLKDSAVKMRLKRTRDKIRRLYDEHGF